MLWKSGPTLMYQSMWYAPGMGKGATKGRMRRTHPWQELRKPILQLQCHLWIVSLLMQDHLGWSHQVQQVMHPRVVWINLLHLDAAPEKPRTDFHGGTRILVYKQIPGHLMSVMHGLVLMQSSLYSTFWGSIV